ncbi:type II secretion system protein [Pseudomonas capsici]|uniref:type II secretion system protein n=1 Tax=Pseudomonas capsici TaxID=2810614 RepID=UPI000E3CD3BD|nr:type II secretion system protein [Pseudomonas capsici]MBX8606769.1 type II secretion system protein [Pseudomonas cichorii]MCV4288338.1 type II secretion system protein [Pseudomonas capsici]
MRHQRGFTLLEVMVALGIAAVMTMMVSQMLRQRISVHQAVQQHRLGALCARELEARFGVERYWPQISKVSGELQQGDRVCYWRMDLGMTGVQNLRRGELALFAARDEREPLGNYTVFLVRP